MNTMNPLARGIDCRDANVKDFVVKPTTIHVSEIL